MKHKLTYKQKLFCHYYLEGSGNATEAVILAGYKIGTKNGELDRATARSIGWENLTKPDIQNYLRVKLEDVGLMELEVSKQLRDLITQSTDNLVKLRALDLYYKKSGAYAAAKSYHKHEVEIVEVTYYADSQFAHKDAGHGQ